MSSYPYAKFLGIELLPPAQVDTKSKPNSGVECGAECGADSQERIYRLAFRDSLAGNPVLRALHGGVVAGFAEQVALADLALLAEQRFGQAVPVRTIDFHVDYLRSAGPQDSFASSSVVRFGRRAALLEVSCWQAQREKLVARARVHCLVKADS